MSKKDKTFMWIIIILVALTISVFINVYYHFDDKPVISNSDKERQLKDSISTLNREIELSKVREQKLKHEYDSMLTIEPTIIYKTREKIKFVYTEASPNQLDSIIRKGSKRKHRYH